MILEQQIVEHFVLEEVLHVDPDPGGLAGCGSATLARGQCISPGWFQRVKN